MEEPTSPRYEDYGLTEADYERAPQIRFGQFGSLFFNERFIAALFLVPGLTLFAYFTDWFTDLEHWFGAGLGSLFLSPFLAMVILGLLELVEYGFYSLTSPIFRAAKRYDDAHEKYRSALSEYESWLKRRQIDYWRSLSGHQFEYELARLFGQIGFSVEMTPHTGDGGVDLILTDGSGTTVVQCKAHNKKIPIGTARELSAALGHILINSETSYTSIG